MFGCIVDSNVLAPDLNAFTVFSDHTRRSLQHPSLDLEQPVNLLPVLAYLRALIVIEQVNVLRI